MKLYLKTEELPSDEFLDQITEQLKTIAKELKTKTIELSMEERKKSRKMGDRRLAYAEAAERYGEQYENVMPRSFDSKDMTNRLNYFRKLVKLQSAAQAINESIDDTRMATGIDLMTLTKLIHDAIKSANLINPIFDHSLSKLDDFNKRIKQEDEEEDKKQAENTSNIPS